jgi:cytosine/adenosine deaminase-related metal-dependent hydrolase
MIWGRAVSLVNAAADPAVPDAAGSSEHVRGIRSVRFTSRILAINEAPKRGDTVVDLGGARILPGLINAHDHLELNHYGRLKFRESYPNAVDWTDDMRRHLAVDATVREQQRHPLTERLFIGGLKNLLAGVTTVAHHNPRYSELRRTMPIRVVRRYGWAHSFAMEHGPAGARGEPGGEVAQRWRRTSADVPFFVHLAEGVDAPAAAELTRLDQLGCLGPNTLAVHGVAIDAAGFQRIVEMSAGLVWCPASNVFLFGRTANVRQLLDASNGTPPAIALGSDSRLTGANDMLDELRAAHQTQLASADELFDMVTVNAARMLRIRHAGRLIVGQPADLIVIPNTAADEAASLLAARRRDVSLVVVGGRPLIGVPSLAPLFHARGVNTRPIAVDGAARLADSGLVRRIEGCPIAEPGVTWS